MLFGPDVADDYLRRYESAADVRLDPVDDLRALLGWDEDWLWFIPIQVAGRASVDIDGMAACVTETIRRSVARI